MCIRDRHEHLIRVDFRSNHICSTRARDVWHMPIIIIVVVTISMNWWDLELPIFRVHDLQILLGSEHATVVVLIANIVTLRILESSARWLLWLGSLSLDYHVLLQIHLAKLLGLWFEGMILLLVISAEFKTSDLWRSGKLFFVKSIGRGYTASWDIQCQFGSLHTQLGIDLWVE